MGWFNKILVQKVDNGEIVDITELDREHYESFLDVTERLKIAYGIAILREGKESSNEKSNCIKPDVKESALEKLKIAKKALNDIYNFDRDMEFEYGDPGERAMRALEAIDRIDGF